MILQQRQEQERQAERAQAEELQRQMQALQQAELEKARRLHEHNMNYRGHLERQMQEAHYAKGSLDREAKLSLVEVMDSARSGRSTRPW